MLYGDRGTCEGKPIQIDTGHIVTPMLRLFGPDPRAPGQGWMVGRHSFDSKGQEVDIDLLKFDSEAAARNYLEENAAD